MISKIGKYQVEAELGRGGFGVVYRAYDPDVGRPVAIKVLTAESDSELFQRFQDEVGTTGNLIHKNIVTVYESGNEQGVPYLVMELLTGRTLQDLIKHAVPMTLLEKVRIMTQVAQGLKFAHQRNVIHRDVKPGNVMLLNDGDAKIMDFGIARVTTRSTVMTREGYLIGTIPYMAPELFEAGGGGAGKQTDIFAYGVVYYELLTGKHPFHADENIYAVMERIKMLEPESVVDLVPECPETLELLIYRAIAKDRDVRYATFDELLLDGESVLADLAEERAGTLLNQASSLIDAGDTETAERLLKEVADLDPGNRTARQYRRLIQDEKERRKLATRLPALLAEAEEQIAGRRFNEAVQTLESALRLGRNDETVRGRLSDAQARLEAYRQASQLLSEARRDQQKGQLAEAFERLKSALEFDPGHTDARKLFLRIEAELERREKDRKVQDAMRTASAHLAGKRFAQALAALDEVAEDRQRVADLRLRIEREYGEDRHRRRLDLFNAAVLQVREAIHSPDPSQAGGLLDRFSADFAGMPEVEPLALELRGQLDARLRSDAIGAYSQQVRELLKQKWFPEASELIDEAMRRFPGDSGLRRLRESTSELYAAHQRAETLSAALTEAARRRDAGDLNGALHSIAAARQQIGEERALAVLEREIQAEFQQQRYASGLDDLLRRVKEMTDGGRYAAAIQALQAAPEYSGEAEVRAILRAAGVAQAKVEEQNLVNSVLESARSFEQAGTLDRAAGVLREARAKYPHNRALAQAADRVGESIAKAERRTAVAIHRARIEESIAKQDWKTAEAEIARAQHAFPEEALFEAFGGQVRRAMFDAGLDETAMLVREKLAANAVSEAAEQLNVTRSVYAGDPRWKKLEEEVAQRKAYESGLRQAELARLGGDLADAEARLKDLIGKGIDDRPARLLAEVRNERLSEELKGAEQAIQRGEFERALALLDSAARKATPEWAQRIEQTRAQALQRREQETARARERQRREQAAAGALNLARSLHQQGKLEEALRAVTAGLEEAPGHRELLDLNGRVKAEIDEARLRRAREEKLQEVENRAAGLLAGGKPEEAIACLEDGYASEPRFQELLRRARAARDSQRIEQAVAKARELADQQQSTSALQLLKQARERYGESKALAELRLQIEYQLKIQRQREIRELCLAQLSVVESQIGSGMMRERLEGLAAEAQRIANEASTDDEVAAFAAGLRERIQAELRERAAVVSTARDLLANGHFDAARSRLRDLPGDRDVVDLRSHVESRIEEERRRIQQEQELQRAAERVKHLLAQDEPEGAIALLENDYPSEPVLVPWLAQARRDLAAKRIRQALSAAEDLRQHGRLPEALQILDQALRDGPADAISTLRVSIESELQEQRRREARERDIALLLRLDAQAAAVASPRKLRRLAAEASRIGAPHGADPEIASLVDRLRKHTGKPARAKPLPWKPVAWGLGVAAALASVVLIALRKPAPPERPATIVTEIRTTPAGAAVSAGSHSCVTPNCRFDLAPGAYRIEAKLDGYQTAEQTVNIDASSGPAHIDLTLRPASLPATAPPEKTTPLTGTLLVETGIADALVFVDNVPRGRTDSAGTLSLPLEPKAYRIRVERSGYQTPAEQRIRVTERQALSARFNLVPQSARVEARGAPPGVEARSGAVQPPLPAPPTPAEVEARDWEHANAAGDPAQVQAYLDKHPSGPHAAAARARLDDLAWARGSADPQAYLSRFPQGAHAAEAARRMEEARRAAEAKAAQARAAEIEARKLEQERTAHAEAKPQADGEKVLIQSALERFNLSFDHKSQRELKAVWPGAPAIYLGAVTVPHTTLKLVEPASMEITGAQATVLCTLVSDSTQPLNHARRAVRVALQKRGGDWIVTALTANR